MPISDDDLFYLCNINTRPGPNAGESIDPTKPGPDADRASPEPQDVRERPDSPRALARVIQPWLRSVCSNSDSERLARDIGEEVSQHLRKAPALAQSDAGQEPGNDFPDCIEKTLADLYTAPPRPDASGLIETAEWPFGYQDTFSLISDATGLVGGHIGISVSKFEKAYNKLRSRAADRSGK